jgi:hypothetical protein
MLSGTVSDIMKETAYEMLAAAHSSRQECGFLALTSKCGRAEMWRGDKAVTARAASVNQKLCLAPGSKEVLG